MKFKITLTPSNYYQDDKKSKYQNPVIIESLEVFKKVILKDLMDIQELISIGQIGKDC